MFKKLNDAAASLKEKTDVSAKLAAAKEAATSHYEAGKSGATAAWDAHWPVAEHMLVERLLSVAEESLRDDDKLHSVLANVYEALPFAARLVLSRERFLEFTMARRGPLLLKVADARAQRQPGGAAPALANAAENA